MALHVVLSENTLQQGLPTRPRVVNRQSLGFEELLRRMSSGTAISTEEMQMIFERMIKEMVPALAYGQRVETPIGSFTATIRGQKNGHPRKPDVLPENTVIRFKPAQGLLNKVKGTITVALEPAPDIQKPKIECLFNFETKEVTNQVSAGQMIQLQGARLSFDPEKPEEGVFFEAADGTKVRSPLHTRHGSGMIDCRVPELAPGVYTLHVCATRHSPVIRDGVYPEPVTVV